MYFTLISELNKWVEHRRQMAKILFKNHIYLFVLSIIEKFDLVELWIKNYASRLGMHRSNTDLDIGQILTQNSWIGDKWTDICD